MVAELIVIVVLACLVAAAMLHQFTIIKRQSDQIVALTKLVALKDGDPNVVMHIDREDISRQNQASAEGNMHIRPIT